MQGDETIRSGGWDDKRKEMRREEEGDETIRGRR
jgi:hypothetical protein